VIVAIDQQSAKDITSFAHGRPDLLLINVVGKSLDEALRIGRAIRHQASVDKIPLVVMAEKFDVLAISILSVMRVSQKDFISSRTRRFRAQSESRGSLPR